MVTRPFLSSRLDMVCTSFVLKLMKSDYYFVLKICANDVFVFMIKLNYPVENAHLA